MMKKIDSLFPPNVSKGERYQEDFMKMTNVDTPP